MPAASRTYRFDDFTLETREHRLRQQGREVFLRPKAFETLLHLVSRHGHLVMKEELIDRVWSGTSVTDAVLTHCIAEVRKALKDDVRDPRFLKTVPRVGYKFIGKAEEIVSDGDEPEAANTVAPSSAIAVLPFVNLSGDPENEYLCDGLSEELINGLTKIGELRVVAHSSAFTFKGRVVDVREIGRKLNVGSVLEGSVRKAGDRLRISAQLVDAGDGYHLWSEQFDRQSGDVFAIQDEISLAILKKLKVKTTSEETHGLVRVHAGNVEAYHCYLKGRSFWHRRNEGFLQKAMDCFQQAIKIDPAYVPPYVGLADCCNSLGIWGFASPREVFPRARELTQKALETDDALADAHASRAVVNMFYDWDWAGAKTELRRAIELNPGYALGHLWYGHLLSIVGRFDDAIDEVRVAQNLDPLSPTVNANVGYTLFLARHYGAAGEEIKNTLELDPHCATAHFYLGGVYGCQGRYAEAIEEHKKGLEISGGALLWAVGFMGCIYGRAGDRHNAEKILRLFDEKQGYVPSSARAVTYAGMGEDERVYEWLDRAFAERDALMPWVNSLPVFDRLRSQSRFQDLVRRLGLS